MERVAVIMAGGSGTRLWPLSRRDRPKQLVRLIEGKSLLRLSFERLAGLVPASGVMVIAAEAHLDAIAAEVPELPRENLVGEPCGRDTANAVALSAAIVAARWPDAVMGVFTADHVIRPVERFAAAVRTGFELAEASADTLVTFGIRATHAHTGLGYVQRGAPLGPAVYAVQRFREKPDAETAAGYVASGEYYWNSGMFAWRPATVLAQLRQRLPESHALVTEVAAGWPGAAARQMLADRYGSLTRISIDFAVMEHAPKVAVVEMPVEWHDVGSWPALVEVLGRDAAGNTIAATHAATRNATGNLIVSEEGHLVALVGVQDLAVVHARHATLVCRLADAQRVRELVSEIEQRYSGRYS
ncbi:MAG: mannose-1-phosphate guanylyltransferase [Phycisphaerae bacterium]